MNKKILAAISAGTLAALCFQTAGTAWAAADANTQAADNALEQVGGVCRDIKGLIEATKNWKGDADKITHAAAIVKSATGKAKAEALGVLKDVVIDSAKKMDLEYLIPSEEYRDIAEKAVDIAMAYENGDIEGIFLDSSWLITDSACNGAKILVIAKFFKNEWAGRTDRLGELLATYDAAARQLKASEGVMRKMAECSVSDGAANVARVRHGQRCVDTWNAYSGSIDRLRNWADKQKGGLSWVSWASNEAERFWKSGGGYTPTFADYAKYTWEGFTANNSDCQKPMEAITPRSCSLTEFSALQKEVLATTKAAYVSNFKAAAAKRSATLAANWKEAYARATGSQDAAQKLQGYQTMKGIAAEFVAAKTDPASLSLPVPRYDAITNPILITTTAGFIAVADPKVWMGVAERQAAYYAQKDAANRKAAADAVSAISPKSDPAKVADALRKMSDADLLASYRKLRSAVVANPDAAAWRTLDAARKAGDERFRQWDYSGRPVAIADADDASGFVSVLAKTDDIAAATHRTTQYGVLLGGPSSEDYAFQFTPKNAYFNLEGKVSGIPHGMAKSGEWHLWTLAADGKGSSDIFKDADKIGTAGGSIKGPSHLGAKSGGYVFQGEAVRWGPKWSREIAWEISRGGTIANTRASLALSYAKKK